MNILTDSTAALPIIYNSQAEVTAKTHIKASDLNIYIQGNPILRNINLAIPEKKITCIIGPSGCGKTLASYVIASELEKIMVVINLGAIVSSRLGETSKNLSKVFKRSANEDLIIFFDEFDSLRKIRDYDQDQGEMKRIENTKRHHSI